MWRISLNLNTYRQWVVWEIKGIFRTAPYERVKRGAGHVWAFEGLTGGHGLQQIQNCVFDEGVNLKMLFEQS